MYRAPVSDIAWTLRHVAGLADPALGSAFSALSSELLDAVLAEAGRFASDRMAPLNRVGDREGARLIDGEVVTPSGWRDAYRAWASAGWNGVAALRGSEPGRQACAAVRR